MLSPTVLCERREDGVRPAPSPTVKTAGQAPEDRRKLPVRTGLKTPRTAREQPRAREGLRAQGAGGRQRTVRTPGFGELDSHRRGWPGLRDAAAGVFKELIVDF